MGSVDTLEDLAEFALELAAAGEVICPLFRNSKVRDKSAKGRFDPVTQADLAAERRMREMIRARYPDHGVRGEEMPESAAGGAYSWLLDPIDGTHSFVYGLPTWMTLVALLHEGRPLIGVASQPLLGEAFLGMPGGAWRIAAGRRERLRVRGTERLGQALTGTTLPDIYETAAQRAVLEAMRQAARQVRYDADAYFYALLAAGQTDLAFDTGLSAHDIAALIPIVRGAGGLITDWDGKADPLGGDVLAASTPALHDQALELLARARGKG